MLEDVPEILTPFTKMNKPNENIVIYEGEFILKREDKSYKIKNGIIYFKWLPDTYVEFSGDITINTFEGFELLGDCYLDINKQNKYYIVQINFFETKEKGLKEVNSSIRGRLKAPVKIGTVNKINKLRFEIPNLREMSGEPLFQNEDGRKKYSVNRLNLDTEEFKIEIDKLINYKELHKSLKREGGYIITYTGNIINKKNNNFNINDIRLLLNSLAAFLSFMNGRKTAPLFRKGINKDNEVVWEDFTSYIVDQYKFVNTWLPQKLDENINELWLNFYHHWQDENDRECLNTALHWYVEANKHSGLLNGAIVLIHNALELLFNWIIVEKYEVYTPSKAKKLSASQKIEQLIELIHLNSLIPETLEKLSHHFKSEGIANGPEAFCLIRNSLVHSKKSKREKLKKMDNIILFEALQLGIWYVELTLLYELDYKGKYFNRCSKAQWKEEGEEPVPWNKH